MGYPVTPPRNRLYLRDFLVFVKVPSFVRFSLDSPSRRSFLRPGAATLFRTQPEHAVYKSRPAAPAKNHQSPGDAERPPNVSVTTDKDSRDSQPDTQRHTQAAIHSPQIQNRHTASLSSVLDRDTSSSRSFEFD